MHKRRFFMLGKDQAKEHVKNWLKATFKPQPGNTLAREWVFREYQKFCVEERIESTSQSAFGRILKDVFPALKHRRLGPRNNNKMHYQHLGLRTQGSQDSGAEHRTSSSGPPTPLSPPFSTASRSVSSSPIHPYASPALQTADGVLHSFFARPTDQRTGVVGELELTSIEDEWDSTMSALASPPSQNELAEFPVQPSSSATALSSVPEYGRLQGAVVPERDDSHPWVMLPFLASAQLLDRDFDLRNPSLQLLIDFVERFLATGNWVDLPFLEEQLIANFDHCNTDPSVHYALFVLAWWVRLLARNEAEGRHGAASILRRLLPTLGHFDSQLASPATELLHSCQGVPPYDRPTMLSLDNTLELKGILDLWKQAGDVDQLAQALNRPKLTAGKVLFHATQALSLETALERAHSAELLAHELMKASAPLLVVSLHELDCRGMLEMAVNVLHDLRERRPDVLSPLPGLLERTIPFEGMHDRFARAVSQVEGARVPQFDHSPQFGSLPVPMPPHELAAYPPPVLLHFTGLEAASSPRQPKSERPDSDDHAHYSVPSSPFPVPEHDPYFTLSGHYMPAPPPPPQLHQHFHPFGPFYGQPSWQPYPPHLPITGHAHTYPMMPAHHQVPAQPAMAYPRSSLPTPPEWSSLE